MRSADSLFGQRRSGFHQRGPADDHRTERPRPLAQAQLRETYNIQLKYRFGTSESSMGYYLTPASYKQSVAM
ncbi:MAG: putative zinc-binding metallopeptidase [Alistipes finegoldii]